MDPIRIAGNLESRRLFRSFVVRVRIIKTNIYTIQLAIGEGI